MQRQKIKILKEQEHQEKEKRVQHQKDAEASATAKIVRPLHNQQRAYAGKTSHPHEAVAPVPFFKGEITLSSCANLPKSDFLSKGNPVCIVKYGGTFLLETKCVEDTYDPVWNEKFEMNVMETEDCKELCFEIFDIDSSSSRFFMARVMFSSAQVRDLMRRSKNATRTGEQSFQSSHVFTKGNPIQGNEKAETTIRLNVRARY